MKLNTVFPNTNPVMDANGINKNNRTLSLEDSQPLLMPRHAEMRISKTYMKVEPSVQLNIKYTLIRRRANIITI